VYLDENLERLNRCYKQEGLQFRKDGDTIRVVEKTPYLFNKFTTLKNLLRKNFDLQFDNKLLWHFNAAGIEKLSDRKLKWKPTKEINELIVEFRKHLERLEETKLKDSMTQFFHDNPCFFKCPASLGIHHAYVGGLLEHSVQTVNMALGIRDSFDEDVNINLDLVIAGAVLHDVGKINCYQLDGSNIGKTRVYNIQNHIVNGIKIVSKNIESAKLDDLIHIIASHHSIKEWGSPVRPQSNEAWIIHNIENLSSKIMG
jgi:putative nucleotidyltransferase with HDIG domain